MKLQDTKPAQKINELNEPGDLENNLFYDLIGSNKRGCLILSERDLQSFREPDYDPPISTTKLVEALNKQPQNNANKNTDCLP